jgi:RNA polymerase sigma factor (TIGR02999 family)
MLKDARILVIANARGSASGPMQDRGKPAFTVEENDAVQAWVRGGDALLLIAGHWPIVSAMGDLSLKFDVMMGKGFTHDPQNNETDSDGATLVFARRNKLLLDHPISAGRTDQERLNRIVAFTGQSLKGSPLLVQLLGRSGRCGALTLLKHPYQPRLALAHVIMRPEGPGVWTYKSRSCCGQHLRKERQDHTLQPTALVNEVYLRIFGSTIPQFSDRAHFMAIASRTMRGILVDYARARGSAKRGGNDRRITLDTGLEMAMTKSDAMVSLLDLDLAIEALARENPYLAQVIEMRYFGGMTAEETAEVVGRSVHIVQHELRFAHAWLRRKLAGPESG